MPRPVIALMTDFGVQDHYVGVMKGVMKSICDDVDFIDITHQIPPQDVRTAAFTLMNNHSYFPAGTHFLVIVDPGVGTERYPIAAKVEGRVYVGPDNGVLSYLPGFDSAEIHVISNPDFRLKSVSRTFHGRDVFSPAVAHIAAGVLLSDLGDKLENPVLLPRPRLEISEERINGEVLYIDHFGNIITSIGVFDWEEMPDIRRLRPQFGGPIAEIIADSVQIRISEHHKIGSILNSYNDVDAGGIVPIVGSSGYLEISVNRGNAAELFHVNVGDPVRIRGGITLKES